MTESPLVSVIVPVYNVEKYIDKCIDSICRQTYSQIEILLMVGICADDSLLRCVEWQKHDSRIIIVSRKDHSLSDARNYAMQISKGKYIAYVDADDFIEATYIQRLVEGLEINSDIDISCCGFKCFGNKRGIESWVPQEEGCFRMDFKRYVETIPFGMVWLKMYRKEWLLDREMSMFDGCHEDDALHICLASTVNSIHFVPYPLYNYNQENENSLMNGNRHILEYADALRHAFNYLKRHDLYAINKKELKQFTTPTLLRLLRENKYDKALLDSILKLWREFFPELALEMDYYCNIPKKKEDKVIIFGAGADCKKTIRKIGKEHIFYIVDNNVDKIGSLVEGIPVYSFEEMLNEKPPVAILISSSRFFFDMARQLRENGITNYLDISEYL